MTTSCGCTIVGSLPTRVKPFHGFDVPLTINLQGRSGNFSSLVTVDLGHGKAAQLGIKAKIFPSLPERIAIGRKKQGELVTSIYALPHEINPVSISTAEPTLSDSDTQVWIDLDRSGDDTLVQIHSRVPQKSGDFFIQFNLPSANGETLDYVIEGHAINEIEATPAPLISLGYLKEGSVSSGYADFVSSYGKPFRLRPELCQHSASLTIEDATADTQIRAKVYLDSPVSSGVYRETVQFCFESTETPGHIVLVPVEVYGYKVG